MNQIKIGAFIAECRRAINLTQAQLAEELGITDKAVSKWERDLSCPDISSIPKLAEVLGVTVDELMQSKAASKEEKTDAGKIIDMVLKVVPLAMGIALFMVSILKKDVDIYTVAGFAGIGLFGISLYQLRKDTRKD